MKNDELTEQELRRYSRQVILPEIGKEGQLKIKNARVLIIGAGGLGSPAAIYLAVAGVGTIGIMDFDKIDETNLQRQILYSDNDIGKLKTATIKNQISKLNPNINVITHNEKLTSENALNILKNYDIIIDGSDNLSTKFLVNDACIALKKPFVYGSIFKFDGHVSVFNYQNGPCYRCLFSSLPSDVSIPNCAETGVLGVLPGVIGTMQATEALKIVLGKGNTLSGRYLIYNALKMNFNELKLRKNPNCEACGKNPIQKLARYDEICNQTINQKNNNEINVKELKEMIDSKEKFELIDVRENDEWELCRIETAKLIPLSIIIKNKFNDFNELNKNEKIIVYCHTGNRSGYVVDVLKEKGFSDAKNLIGGIDAWAKDIDSKLMTY